MSTVAEAEKMIFSLSEKDRAELIGKVLRSLPLYADDAGLAEALRRDCEAEDSPDSIISMEQLDDKISKRLPFVRQ